MIALFLTTCALGQQTPSSTVVTATMPQGATKPTKDELAKYIHDNYKRSQVPLDKTNTYKLNGLLISFWDLSINPPFKKSLEASQSEILGYLKQNSENTINYSKIITVNDIRFLVYVYQKGNEEYLRFQSEYNKDNKNICGLIQCKKPDEVEAEETLQTFLSTIHFK